MQREIAEYPKDGKWDIELVLMIFRDVFVM